MTKTLLEADPSIPLVQVSLLADCGATLDPEGKVGLTRLLTRLMRRSAHGLSASAVDERLDSLGSSLGADVGYSTAGYAGSVLRRSVDAYIDVLRGVLLDPKFEEAEFEKLKRETLAEIVEQRDDDRTVARMWFRRTFFDGHAYGRGVTGTSDSIRALTLDDIHDAYRKGFLNSFYCLGFAGDISAEESARYSEALLPPSGANAPLRAAPEPPRGLKGPHLLLVDKPERTQTQILIGCLGTHTRDEDHTALTVANTVFGGTFTARLTQEVRAKRGWSYGAYSSLPVDRARQAFSMWTFPQASDAGPCVELELQLLRDWVDNGITEDELSWAKHYLVRSHVFSTDTAAKRLGLAQDEVMLELEPGYHERFPERVQAVTVKEANEAIKRRIDLDRLLIVVLGTVKDIETDVKRAAGDAFTSNVVAFDA